MPYDAFSICLPVPCSSFSSIVLKSSHKAYLLTKSSPEVNPISTGLFCFVVALGGGGGCFHPPSITPLSLKLDCSNFVQSYFQIG